MARTSAAAVASRRTATRSAGVDFGIPERALRLLHEARWIAMGALGVFVLLILATYHKADPGWSHAVPTQAIANAGGRVGAWFADLLLYLFGLSAYLFVALLAVAVARGFRALRVAPGEGGAHRFHWERWLGFALLLLGAVASSRRGCIRCAPSCRWGRAASSARCSPIRCSSRSARWAARSRCW